MLSRAKLVVVAAGLVLSLGTGAGIASAEPDTSAIVNSTCTYPQVMAALNDQSPNLANELNANPLAVGWLQPALQPYIPVINQVAHTCNNY